MPLTISKNKFAYSPDTSLRQVDTVSGSARGRVNEMRDSWSHNDVSPSSAGAPPIVFMAVSSVVKLSSK